MDLDTLAKKATVVLARHLGQEVILTNPQLLKDATRCLVVRCRVQPVASASIGFTSVILKQIQEDIVRGFSDWASLAFLSRFSALQNVTPAFLGGDIAERFFLMNDLGGSDNLEVALLQGTANSAGAALRTLAVQMARLHGATLAEEDAFEAVRRRLPGAEGLGRKQEAENWLAGKERFDDWFEAADCMVPAGWSECWERIAQVYREPGEFLSFTHGDPAPSNNHIAPDGLVRLLDFEYGGYRHALYDITAWNILCPLPVSSVQEMSACFRAELAQYCPSARDEARYISAWGYLCAYRALAILTWIGPDVLQENRPWVDASWTARHAVLAAVSRLYESTIPVGELSPVSEAAYRLSVRLRSQWREFDDPDTIATSWPALSRRERI